MKRTLSTIFTAALLAVSMILAVGAAHLKTDIAGNMAIGGNFDSGEEHAKSHFWFGRSDDVNPYRGTTIVYQSKGGVADSGCLRINGTDAGAPGLCYGSLLQCKCNDRQHHRIWCGSHTYEREEFRHNRQNDLAS